MQILRELSLVLVGLAFPVVAGCSAGRTHTVVEKRVRPRHFKFTTLVEKTDAGPGGWRTACLHLQLQRTVGHPYICRVGVEMPLETTEEGTISTPHAQRVAASCANLAADLAFAAVMPETPLGMACTRFIETYAATLWRALKGSRVMRQCRDEAEPVIAP